MRATKDEYHLAKIIKVRPIKDKDEEHNQLEKVLLGNNTGSGNMEEEKKEDVEMVDMSASEDKKQQYEYYVHYENLQRRNDRWIREQDLKFDPEEMKR